MSLNRALGELFRAIREEAAQNPVFAARLGEALALYRPPRRSRIKASRPPEPLPAVEAVMDAALVAFDPEPPPVIEETPPEPALAAPVEPTPAINPVALLQLEGEGALRDALGQADLSRDALAALVAEHNLDPAGQADDADRDALVEQIVAQARKRVERDSKLFDY